MKSFWDSLGRGSKLGLSIGILTILIATSVAAFFLFKVEYQVLFSDLKAQDSAVMVAELEKQRFHTACRTLVMQFWLRSPLFMRHV